jgi:hypothetical protein
MISADETHRSIVNPKDGSEIGHPSRDPKLFKQIHLTRHPILRTFDLGIGKGTSSADLAIIEDQVESVRVLESVVDPVVQLGGGEGAEEGEVGVDLIVLVGKLDVMFPTRQSKRMSNRRKDRSDKRRKGLT